MANDKAIAAVGHAIVNMLTQAASNEFPEAEFKLLQATDFAIIEQHIKEGASVYLYQVEIVAQPSLNSRSELSVPSISLKLRILITPWASDPEKQYHLLGWIIHVLHDTPILTATFLNGLAPNEVIFSPDETVRLVFETLSLSDLSILTQNLQQPGVLPSLTYSASLVLGESF